MVNLQRGAIHAADSPVFWGMHSSATIESSSQTLEARQIADELQVALEEEFERTRILGNGTQDAHESTHRSRPASVHRSVMQIRTRHQQTIHSQTSALDALTEAWHPNSPHSPVWRRFAEEENAVQFGDFLNHLSRTAEYANPRTRPYLIRRMINILDDLQTAPALRALCFRIAEDATSSCGDRVAVTLNHVEMACINHRAEQNQYSTDDLVAIGRGMFRLEALSAIARDKIASLGGPDHCDPVEVHLAFQTKLAATLALPGMAESMLFANENVSKVTDADLKNAVIKITDREAHGDVITFMVNWQPWQQAIERARPTEFLRLQRQFSKEKEAIALPPPEATDQEWIDMINRQKATEADTLREWRSHHTRILLALPQCNEGDEIKRMR
jgi:hypothetical protein